MISGVSKILSFALFLLISGTVLFSCTQKKSINGKEFIKRETLVKVLVDIHLIDGITNDVKYYRYFNAGDSIDLYGPIFEKHEVTGEQYDRTMEAYSEYPALLDEVYDDVLMELNMLKDELSTEEVQAPSKGPRRTNEKRTKEAPKTLGKPGPE